MFTKILIANRGEIAVRVMRACRELGIASVAVHSSQDAGSFHVRAADEAVDLGGGAAAENYLDIAKIVDAARSSGAEAIHPGYGFLSENAEFAAAVKDAGLTFIGPTAEAISVMGAKIAAREAAIAADVPLAPGSDGPVDSADQVVAFGEEHGYPLLVKASAGGGGRGMRRIDSADQAAAQFEAAVREATAAFGNGQVYVERYLVDARHIEVQVMADRHGNVVYFGDRDCSVQRRHQKLIEEAPAPGLSDATRTAMGEAATRLAREVGYEGAGTVEFLLEGDRFYFLEMNTRIQVEHPVTELVQGVDLIQEQIRVAAGAPLSITESGRPADGVAIEARINAENPAGGRFLPAPGTIELLDVPEVEGVRFDAGYESGDEVLPLYDSLIGKLIVWGPDRETVIDRLREALAGFVAEGITTTAPAAHLILGEDAFREVEYNTLWLEDQVTFPEELEDFPSEAVTDRQEVEVAGRVYWIPVFSEHAGAAGAGTPAAEPAAERRGGAKARRRRGGGAAFDGTLKAPMQGTIIKSEAAAGDSVSAGQTLFILEAMKMENPIVAPADGVLTEVSVTPGDVVASGAVLARIETGEAQA